MVHDGYLNPCLASLLRINFTAALVFRFFGLSSQGVRYQRGKRWLFPVTLGLTVAILVSLLTWQFAQPINLERSTLDQRANAEVQQVVEQNPLVDLVEANVRFTRSKVKGQNTLLTIVYVQPKSGVNASKEEIRSRLMREIQTRLQK